MIGRLLAAGVDVFRLNFSHGAQADHAQVARFIRKQLVTMGDTLAFWLTSKGLRSA
jgi:pyruvate kinase